MTPENIFIYETREELCRAAAELFITLSNSEVARKGIFTVALSGGKTPEGLLTLLGSEEYRDRVRWDRAHVFWGDERCVEPESMESNYRTACKAMLSRIEIPFENIHRMQGEADPEKAALDYEKEILRVFRSGGDEFKSVPVFDLVFLGLGEDGHTLSLFPDSGALREDARLVAPNYVEKLKAWRLTMTLRLVNNASNLVFLVSGRAKAGALKDVVRGAGACPLPAGLITPAHGRLMWLVDREAASLL